MYKKKRKESKYIVQFFINEFSIGDITKQLAEINRHMVSYISYLFHSPITYYANLLPDTWICMRDHLVSNYIQ